MGKSLNVSKQIIWLLYWVCKISGLIKIFVHAFERVSAKNKVKVLNIITVQNKKYYSFQIVFISQS